MTSSEDLILQARHAEGVCSDRCVHAEPDALVKFKTAQRTCNSGVHSQGKA